MSSAAENAGHSSVGDSTLDGTTYTFPLIVVLLPVFNGSDYLQEQIDSIVRQTHQHFLLVCRDDGSTDDSPALLEQYRNLYKDKFIVIDDNKGNLGASGSFSELMQWALNFMQSTEQQIYVALSDQDDIWHADKLATTLKAMTDSEDGIQPVLVHSDLNVVDKEGRLLSPSLMKFQGLDPTRTSVSAQLMSNTVTGCTVLMNQALLLKALPVPAGVVMHDWWLSLVVSCFGKRVFINRALVEYRQHGRNTLGAREYKPPGLSIKTLGKIFQYRQQAEQQKFFEDVATQASAFHQRFAPELSEGIIKQLSDVMRFSTLGLWGQRFAFRRLRRSN